MTLPEQITTIIDNLPDQLIGNFASEQMQDQSIYRVSGVVNKQCKETSSQTYDSPAEYNIRTEITITEAVEYEDGTGETIHDFTKAAQEYADEVGRNNSEF